ncbi:ankyrin repeat-containing protein At5g02620-like isoform X1 [Cornus florida]|uniref:ankyrin repeat-containing protein At5g02620-like isoform X1 n=1 Tax=Cornus florida TaxID=4283 RepID=UPI0028A00FC2|nr:ankyrin repeat-containing protein At5g02620-like isoform X1 [Cornus florida]
MREKKEPVLSLWEEKKKKQVLSFLSLWEEEKEKQVLPFLSVESCFPDDVSPIYADARLQHLKVLIISVLSCSPDKLSHNPKVKILEGILNSAETTFPPHMSPDQVQELKDLITSVIGEIRLDLLPPSPMYPTSSLQVGAQPTTNLTMYVPLYQAALTGDWDKANEFIRSHPYAPAARITKRGDTALHIAAGAKQTKFVEELVKLMDPKDLEMQNCFDNTALCFAAASGIKKIAEVMVKKNKNLPAVRGSNGVTALHMAALFGYRDMVRFLYSVTDDKDLTKEDYIGLLLATIRSDLYDVSLEILQVLPEPKLAIERDSNGETALHVLARKPSAFSSTSQLGIWQTCIYPWIHMQTPDASGNTPSLFKYQNHKNSQGTRDVREGSMPALKLLKCLWEQALLLDLSHMGDLLRSPSRPLFVAVEFGNFEFIVELMRSYPDLIWKVDEQSRSIFHIAVMHRQEKIFKLIYGIGAHKDLISAYKDPNGNNMLHLAGKLAPSNRLNIVSGAALQMQRELLWFKEVEKNVLPSYREMENTKGQTPQMLFTEEHKKLVEEGEKWMKGTASSCMLVATLITTVMFAAIFTVPGGNSNKGAPIFLKAKSFIIFTISDASALFSSVTSILMFLFILTSRYAEEDFLESLPKRLIIGLTTLFFSIASMLIAFSATFFVLLGNQLAWVVIPVALATAIPVTLFAFLQFPLLADMMHSTYGSGIFPQQSKDKIYTFDKGYHPCHLYNLLIYRGKKKNITLTV